MAANIWSTSFIDGITQPIIYLETPNPRPDRVCPDGTNNYYGDAAKMTGLSISVTPNTNYTIQATVWVFDQLKGGSAAINVNPSLSFRVNNQTVKMDSFSIDKWTTVTGTWNSVSTTMVSSLGIWDNQGVGCGNDYMIAGAPTQTAPSLSTNTPTVATLQVRQIVLSPVPVNLLPPSTFSYTGNNGWSAPAISNAALNIASSSNPIALTAHTTDTTVFTTLPDARWFVSSFARTGLNAAVSGNPSGNLALPPSRSTVTVPATYVRAGATLRCTLAMGHLTP